MNFSNTFEKLSNKEGSVNMSEDKNLSRRKFMIGGLATVAMAGAAAVGGGLIGNKEALAATETWDAEADVVILGFGAGGGGAAVGAAGKGDSVLVLESMPVPGGTTRCSGGGIWVPNNNVMKAEGYEDSVEDSRAYMIHGNDGQVEDEMIEAYIENGVKAADFLQTTVGITWSTGLPDYHPEWEGGKKKGRHLSPSYNGKRGGEALMSAMYDYALAKGVKFSLNTHAKKLIKDQSGAVIGVLAYQDNKEYRVRARKGVVISTGGFEWDQRYVKNFQRGPQVASVTFNPGSGGGVFDGSDGLKMAIDAGADLRNMNESWGLLVYLLPGWEEEVASYRANAKNYKASTWKKIIADWFIWRGKPGTMIVNKHGERFMNEACDYDTSVYPFYSRESHGENTWRNVPAYLIADSNEWEKFAFAGIAPGSNPPGQYVAKGDTLAELAKKLGINPDGLQKTVSTFNMYASQNPPSDPFFHRGESFFDRTVSGDASIAAQDPDDPAACLAPLNRGPYYGIEIHPANCGTCGGPRINGKAQVLNVEGEAIPGLYAAGNVAGLGGPGITYNGPGNPVGGGVIFGYVAGENITKI